MGYNVLIVDDSATMRKMVLRVLEMSGVDLGEIHEAEDGLHALEVMGRHELDLILADINMPRMNGLEMTERMQASGKLNKIPVIVISTEASATRVDDLKAKGVKGYIHKPFTPEQIRQTIQEVLGACHAGNE